MVEMTLFHLYAAVRKREGVDDGGHIQGEDLRNAILRVFVSRVNVFGGVDGGGRWIPVPLTCSGKRLDIQPFYRDEKRRYNLPGGDLSWFFGQIAEN